MSESTFETWGAEGSPITVEYSVVVLEEIRAQVSQGLMKFSRGGMEVGGLLYGSRDGNQLRIEAIRAIHCDHSNGPSFVLSSEDRAKLDAQLAEHIQDSHLQSLQLLGWFVSHTRAELAMTASDLEIFATYLKEPWQVTLVVRPGRSSQLRAGFFVRESDGSVKSDQSRQEFAFPDRLAAVMEALPRAERQERNLLRASLPPLPSPPPTQPTRHQASPPQTMFEPMPYPSPSPERKKWPWLVAGLAVVAILAFVGLRYFWQPAPPESLGLQVTEREGELQIIWNNASRTVVRATKGTLEISDGVASERVPLTRSQLSDGHYFYTRKGGDVEVRMQVESTDGSLGESARFLGRAPQPEKANELQLAEMQRTELEQENQKLKKENAALNDRIQQLERAQKILEMRLGITGAK